MQKKKKFKTIMLVLGIILGGMFIVVMGGFYLVIYLSYQTNKPPTTYKKDTFTKEEEEATRYVLGITNNEKYQISTSTCATRGRERIKAYIHTDEENLSTIMKELYGYSEEEAEDEAYGIEIDFGRVPNKHGYTEPYTNMLGQEVQPAEVDHADGIESYIWEEGKGYGIEIVVMEVSKYSEKLPDVRKMYQETGEKIEDGYSFFVFFKEQFMNFINMPKISFGGLNVVVGDMWNLYILM